ncbi:MAG: DUF6020 family protein [Coprococcus sp.]
MDKRKTTFQSSWQYVLETVLLSTIVTFALLISKTTISWKELDIGTEEEIISKALAWYQNSMKYDMLVIDMVWALLCAFFWKVKKQIRSETVARKWIYIVTSIILAIFMIIGDSFKSNGDLSFVYYSKFYALVSMAVFAGYALLIYYFMFMIGAGVEKYRAKEQSLKCDRRRLQLYMFGGLILAWLPYIIAYFPGSVTTDAMNQINQALGQYPFSNHHPVVSSLFMGLLIRLGRIFSNDYLGIFLMMLFEVVFTGFVFTKLIIYIHDISQKNMATAIMYILHCIQHGDDGTVGIKGYHVYSNICCIFYILYKTDNESEEFWSNKWNIVWSTISMLAVCFWRNNGIYVVLISALLLLCEKILRKRWIRIIVQLAFVCIVYFVAVKLIYPACGILPGSSREILSIPFQQTARYVREYSDEVTESEKKSISGVLEYDTIAEKYNPDISDYVKKTFKEKASDEDILSYFKTWLSMFAKHPVVYFEATLNNTYNYYYFNDPTNFMLEYQNYTKYDMNRSLNIDENTVFCDGFKKSILRWTDIVKDMPILNLLNRCGIYTWIIIIVTALLWRKKEYKKILVSAPLYLSILVCIASPVNGLQRYAWVIMLGSLLYMALLLSPEAEEADND